MSDLVCGLDIPENIKLGKCKWPHREITYYENMQFSGFTREEVKALYDEAIMSWAKVANITPKRVESATGANIVADTGIMFAFAVGVSGIPCGASANSQMKQKYKSNQRWTKDGLLEVMTHEIGHALGLKHGSRKSIMAPVTQGFTKPQPEDVGVIQGLYGPPENQPSPTPTPTPTPNPEPSNPKTLKFNETTLFVLDKGKNHVVGLSVPSTGWFNLGRTKVKISATNCLLSTTTQKNVKDVLTESVRGGIMYIKLEHAEEGGFVWVTAEKGV